jgi:Flp pilus assembly protein TadD
LDEAMACSRQVLKLQPDNAEAHNGLGTILLRQGKVPEGIRHLEEALRLKPEDAEAHNSFGVAVGQQGRNAEAVAHFRKVLALAHRAGDRELAVRIASRLQLYQAGRPYHEATPSKR